MITKREEGADDKKLFYRMGEVSEMLGVAPSVLRFWEKNFDCLKQLHKNRRGERLFTEHNISDFRQILFLLREKGYTIQGANEYMNKQVGANSKSQQMLGSLLKIKGFLEGLKDELG